MAVERFQPLGSFFNPFGGEAQDTLNEIGEAAARFEEMEGELSRVIGRAHDDAEAVSAGFLVLRVTAATDIFNATYTIENVAGDVVMVGITPEGRMFDVNDVDFHAATVGTTAVVFPLNTEGGLNPFESPVAPEGACLSETGLCSWQNAFDCSLPSRFLGEGVPCVHVEIRENVKISVCPAPALQPPPPIILGVLG